MAMIVLDQVLALDNDLTAKLTMIAFILISTLEDFLLSLLGYRVNPTWESLPAVWRYIMKRVIFTAVYWLFRLTKFLA